MSRLYITILNDKSYRIRSSEDNVTLYNYVDNMVVSEHNTLKIDTICKFNETIKNKNYKFSVSFNKDMYLTEAKDESQSYFMFYHVDQLANNYLKQTQS